MPRKISRNTKLARANKRVRVSEDARASRDASEHHAWMAYALSLARRGEALASPNPVVGALVVRGGETQDGQQISEGFHTYDGLRHAEIVALDAAGPKARGATLYVTLEPCCHTGRTGPCTRALIEAGVARVVAAMPDPNPSVAGRGFRELRKAGIEVITGVLAAEAQRLNEAFSTWITEGRPFVTLKSALTLDGQLVLPLSAAARGKQAARTRWITSAESRAEVQRMRHASDAILTGIGTVLADDPLLTDRTGKPRRRRLLRVVLDSHLRLSPSSQLARTAKDDVLVFTCANASSQRAKILRSAGVEIVECQPSQASSSTSSGTSSSSTSESGKSHSSTSESGTSHSSAFSSSKSGDSSSSSGAPNSSASDTSASNISTSSRSAYKLRAVIPRAQQRPRDLLSRPGSHPTPSCEPNLREVLAELARRNILSVLLEAGATLNQSALAAGVVDKVRLFYAPILASAFGSRVLGAATHPPRLETLSGLQIERFGPDFAIEAYLRKT